MKKLISTILLITLSGTVSTKVVADYYIKPYFGLSQMSDKSAQTNDIGLTDGKADIELETGFVAGLGFGYQYDSNLAFELSWEYRTNDSKTRLADNDFFEDGNYASNLFYLNGYYFFKNMNRWTPHLGLGLSWAQEVDIDLEKQGTELSFSGDGDIGYQVLAGISYLINDHLSLINEIRYGRISDVSLKGEGIEGELTGLDYEPVTLQIGIRMKF